MDYMEARPEQGSRAPSPAEWHRLWQLWDAATQDMIPRDDITAQPLQLRHPFIFYCGHLPAFTDARLAQVLQQPLTEPAHFADMFARGIDPDLEDPSKCHSHSPVPDCWPQLSVILQYRDGVRARVEALCKQDCSSSAASRGAEDTDTSVEAVPADWLPVAALPAAVQHVLWMCYEHEAMHLETFMYMLVQYDKVKPPPVHLLQRHTDLPAAGRDGGVSQRVQQQRDHLISSKVLGMEKLALELPCSGNAQSGSLPLPAAAAWVRLRGQHVTIGFNAVDHNRTAANISRSLAAGASATPATVAARVDLAPAGPYTAAAAAAKFPRFGWDNESPARTEYVDSCLMQHRPICVLEYLWFLAHQVCRHSAEEGLLQLQGKNCSCHASSTGWATCRASSPCSTWPDGGNGVSVAAGIVAMLKPGGTWHHLVPLSLEVAAAGEFDVAAAAATTTAGGRSSSTATLAGVHDNASNQDAHDQPTAKLATHQQQTNIRAAEKHRNAVSHVFNGLQQLVSVKTVFGSVSVCQSGYWPVYCSASQAQEYAGWWDALEEGSGSGSRLPSEGELLLAQQYTKEALCAAGGLSAASTAAEHLRSVDFNVWHPVDVQLVPETVKTNCSTAEAEWNFRVAGEHQHQHSEVCLVSQLNDNGWEWSQTILAEHSEFTPHPLYPEYSSDFFDGKHHVLLGASWATLNSIAGRKTFRNFYQAGQQHVFAKFRLCKGA